MSHSLPFGLPWGRKSVGFFALRPADRLVVFIHGFNGSAMKTWKGMEALLDAPALSNADVLFYGYRSLAAPANGSAGLFRDLLNNAGGMTAAWGNTLRRGGAIGHREYTDILIVAHSLGAAVTRRALLDAESARASWIDHTRILLFGPAHMGTDLPKLAGTLRSQPGSILFDLFTFARVRTPVLTDLATGSRFLTKLLADSQSAVSGGRAKPIVAEAVVFGEEDYVVVTDPFCNDPLSDFWADEDHCSVCRTGATIPEVLRWL